MGGRPGGCVHVALERSCLYSFLHMHVHHLSVSTVLHSTSASIPSRSHSAVNTCRTRGMKMDFNWRNAAAKYVQLMEWYEPHVCLWSFGIGMCVACLSLRMVIHRTIGQGCNRSASFRALALQLIERPTTLHQDKRCDLLMFIFLFDKALVWRQGDVGHETLCGACLDAPWRLRAVEHDGYQYSCVHKHDSRMKAHTDSYSHSNTAIFPCVHCTAASGDMWPIR